MPKILVTGNKPYYRKVKIPNPDPASSALIIKKVVVTEENAGCCCGSTPEPPGCWHPINPCGCDDATANPPLFITCAQTPSDGGIFKLNMPSHPGNGMCYKIDLNTTVTALPPNAIVISLAGQSGLYASCTSCCQVADMCTVQCVQNCGIHCPGTRVVYSFNIPLWNCDSTALGGSVTMGVQEVVHSPFPLPDDFFCTPYCHPIDMLGCRGFLSDAVDSAWTVQIRLYCAGDRWKIETFVDCNPSNGAGGTWANTWETIPVSGGNCQCPSQFHLTGGSTGVSGTVSVSP